MCVMILVGDRMSDEWCMYSVLLLSGCCLCGQQVRLEFISMTEKMPCMKNEFEEFLKNEGVASGDISMLLGELKINSAEKMMNCVASKEEFVADVWGALVAVDATKKVARRGALLAVYDKVMAKGEADRVAQAEAKLNLAEMELATAEAGKKLEGLNESAARSVLNEQTEVLKLMMKEKNKKVRSYRLFMVIGCLTVYVVILMCLLCLRHC